MQKMIVKRRRAGESAAIIAAVGLLAACSSGVPAPVIVGQATMPPGGPATMAPPPPLARPPAASPIAAAPLAAPMMPASARSLPAPPPRLAEMRPSPPADRPREGVRIVVQPGQSVGGLAAKYHVSRRDIIAANHLPAPYGIETGQQLVIPDATDRPPERIATAAPPPRWVRRAGEQGAPDIIPLDGPPHRAEEAPPQRVALGAAAPPRQEQAAPAEAAAPPGSLIWPVAGRIVEGYGVTRSGRRNDGINIAAPRGAPVRAVDGGIVAYAGNQLRGYGNLVLIKHPDGLISAYAHCEQLLVQRGEHVARGQVIAKVGETGGVAQPQLHFELRQGDRAVDPRRFLGQMQG
jgi:murein DD-endopeptidase MepM/ murein hydrolase activator NlpD